jgi:alpha-glucuronidase
MKTQMKTRKTLCCAAIFCAAGWTGIAEARGGEGGADAGDRVVTIGNAELAVVLGERPSPAEKRVKELLDERIKDRSGIALTDSADQSKFRLVIGTTASNNTIKAFAATRKEVAMLGADGYVIAVEPGKPELYIAGQNDSGVVAGVGRLMREMRYLNEKIESPALQIGETPQMPNRGMYLWARKYYFNQPDQVDRYIEEFALWGGNAI